MCHGNNSSGDQKSAYDLRRIDQDRSIPDNEQPAKEAASASDAAQLPGAARRRRRRFWSASGTWAQSDRGTDQSGVGPPHP